MIQLGQKVRDMVTGFEGIATSRIEFLNGCVRYCVEPPVHEGKRVEGEYFDEQQLEVVGDGVLLVERRQTGGDRPDPRPTAAERGLR